MSERVLDGPCVFCGYNGERYWQDGSHAADCPIGSFVGEYDRAIVIREIVARLVARLAAENAKLRACVVAADRIEGFAVAGSVLIEQRGDGCGALEVMEYFKAYRSARAEVDKP